MATHMLKCWPEPFQAVKAGFKHHEVRKQDRDFQVDDVLILQEWDPYILSDELDLYLLIPEADQDRSEDPRYSGEEIFVKVTYITPGGTFWLPEDTCVMSIQKMGSTSANRPSTKRMAAVRPEDA